MTDKEAPLVGDVTITRDSSGHSVATYHGRITSTGTPYTRANKWVRGIGWVRSGIKIGRPR